VAGEANLSYERIQGLEFTEFGQLHLTAVDYYESAWRTENTGSNPVRPIVLNRYNVMQ
jgi:hypothetical protein